MAYTRETRLFSGALAALGAVGLLGAAAVAPQPRILHPEDLTIRIDSPLDAVPAFSLPVLAGGPAGQSRFAEPPLPPGYVVDTRSSGELSEIFARIGYTFDGVRSGSDSVPRIFVSQLPADLAALVSSDERKMLFINALLPIILHVNEQVVLDRNRLVSLAERARAGMPLGYADRLWLDELAYYYRLNEPDFDTLLLRVDLVPPSMAVAQAAVESGWGTSGLAQQDNALFGQIAIGASSGFASFAEIYDSVEAYIHNLNTHAAYRDFRAARARHRAEGEDLSGYALIGELRAYSELGPQYIQYVRSVIQANGLQRVDTARLATTPVAPPARPAVPEPSASLSPDLLPGPTPASAAGGFPTLPIMGTLGGR